ncbi:hypothetical protein WBG78_06085 [Chryseolinea sp. T2]|uniref:hypothetical protein n=1 Tax=Chryseolinea sp. T2 TaxID=3129255 RepID=UPI003076A046
MKRVLVFFFVASLAILQGCIVKSLHPFYTPNDLVFKKELINHWTDQDGNHWQIVPVKESNVSYELRHYKHSEQPEEIFIAHLFHLNNQLYLDLFPVANDSQANDMMFNMHLIPAHSIARVVKISGNEVQIRWLNEKWLRSLFTENKIKISHEVVRDVNVKDDSDLNYVLTASTEELQKFIIKYGDEDDAFIDDNTVWLKLNR